MGVKTAHCTTNQCQIVAARLNMGNQFVDIAFKYFQLAVEKNFVQGRKTVHVVASCLYIACRVIKSMHMLIDFSDSLSVNVYVLGNCFLKVSEQFTKIHKNETNQLYSSSAVSWA